MGQNESGRCVLCVQDLCSGVNGVELTATAIFLCTCGLCRIESSTAAMVVFNISRSLLSPPPERQNKYERCVRCDQEVCSGVNAVEPTATAIFCMHVRFVQE